MKSLGYSLLEFVIAMLVFSIIGLLVTQTLYSSTHTFHQLSKQHTHIAQLQFAENQLRQDMTYLVKDRTKSTDRAIISGHKTQMQLTRHTTRHTPTRRSNPPLRITYRLNDHQLIRREERLDTTQPSHDHTLLLGVVSLQFHYLSPSHHWQSSWPNAKRERDARSELAHLPRLIKVTVTTQDSGTIEWLLLPGIRAIPS